MTRAGLAPDPWQVSVLRSPASRVALCCSRQVGKTEVARAAVLRTALAEAPALVLVLAPSERQSAEFVARAKDLYEALKARRPVAAGRPVKWYESLTARAGKDDEALDREWLELPEKTRETALQLHLDNGSRIIGLPPNERTIRGYSAAALLVIDEASRVPDALYRAVRPMLAVSRGRLLALTTPFGKVGWFHEEWVSDHAWDRFKVRADQCPRITPEFLAEERQSLGERHFNQEYLCSFEDREGAYFLHSDIECAVAQGKGLVPLF